jgi:hypothetical protein
MALRDRNPDCLGRTGHHLRPQNGDCHGDLMADVIFPGTEMSIFEKYPESRRLDHPNFGDVSKTTFAKGVIIDFEKIGDDPLTVKSRAKVDIGGDWLPIFFNPKEQYWDGADGVLARDFDADGKYFKQAWQSFRGGDEVVVMLKEGKPVAIMGFADGVPRIGEDVVRLENLSDPGTDYLFYLSMQTQDEATGVDSLELGPDGKNLKLEKEHEPYTGEMATDLGDLLWNSGFSYATPTAISDAWYQAHGNCQVTAPGTRG